MENHEYSDIIGNASAPYINGLAQRYALGVAYTGISHPSLPNYMSLTGGNAFFADDCLACTVNAANIADQIEASGRRWKAYFEDMPAPCTTTESGSYTTHHNPFVHYTGIVTNALRCQSHVVPLSDLGADLRAGTVPDYVWLTPNLCSDMHDCSIATGDAWLRAVVPSILSAPDFATSVLFLLWDEGTTSVGGGGHVAMIVISPLGRSGFRSTTVENHFNLLRTIEDAWGLGSLGQANTAVPLTEYFAALPDGCLDTLTLSYSAGTLNLGFTLGSTMPATWSTWLVVQNTPIRLWSVPLPVAFPTASFNVPIPGVPPFGTAYVVTTLKPNAGAACGDVRSVQAGP
jgi:acid phosphatase